MIFLLSLGFDSGRQFCPVRHSVLKPGDPHTSALGCSMNCFTFHPFGMKKPLQKSKKA
jgi:hypothetical protein